MFADTDSRSAYDHLFTTGLSLSKIKDAALGGTLFHLDEACDLASTGVPGRSLAWKVQCSPFFLPRTQRQLPSRFVDLSRFGGSYLPSARTSTRSGGIQTLSERITQSVYDIAV
jgi:hypothetical protein